MVENFPLNFKTMMVQARKPWSTLPVEIIGGLFDVDLIYFQVATFLTYNE